MPETKRELNVMGITDGYVMKELLAPLMPQADRDKIDIIYKKVPHLGIDSTTYTIDVKGRNGNSGAFGRWYVKKFLPQRDVLHTYDATAEHVRDRWRVETQTMAFLDAPHIERSSYQHFWVITRSAGESLRGIFTKAREGYDTGKNGTQKSVQETSRRHIRDGLDTVKATWGKLTKNRGILQYFPIPPRVMDPEEREERLTKQVEVIVRKAAKGKEGNSRRVIEEELENKLREGTTLRSELKDLAEYIAQSEGIIHADATVDNTVYTLGEPAEYDEFGLPFARDCRSTLIDYACVRKGPLGLDLATFLWDPERILSTRELENFFDLEMRQALPLLREISEAYEEVADDGERAKKLIGAEWVNASTAALLKKTANPIAIENHDPKRMKAHVERHPLSDPEINAVRNLESMVGLLENANQFPELSALMRRSRNILSNRVSTRKDDLAKRITSRAPSDH